jgi:hypothetical protein
MLKVALFLPCATNITTISNPLVQSNFHFFHWRKAVVMFAEK